MGPDHTSPDLEHAPGRNRLAGQVAVVFGAGSVGPGWGNGKAAAVQYARDGATLAAHRHPPRRPRRRPSTSSAREGGHCRSLGRRHDQGGGRRPHRHRRCGAFGRIDVLHNNVGGSGTGKPRQHDARRLERDARPQCHERHADLQGRRSAYGGAGRRLHRQHFVDLFIRHLNTPTAVYSAAKGALNELTKNIALDYAGKGIRANCVLPGYIDTPFIRRDIGGKPSYAYKGYESAEAYAADGTR